MQNVYGTFTEDMLTIRRTSNGRVMAEISLNLPCRNRPVEVYTDDEDFVHLVIASEFGRPSQELVYSRWGGLHRRVPLHG